MDRDYEDWLNQVQRQYPACEIRPTRYGAEVWRGDKLVAEMDYEPPTVAVVQR